MHKIFSDTKTSLFWYVELKLKHEIIKVKNTITSVKM